MTQKKKKKKKRFNLIFALLIMLSGVGVIAYPTISDWVVNYQLSQNIDQYNVALEGVEENFDEYWRLAEEYNRYLAGRDLQLTISPEEREYVETLLNPMGTGMIGTIVIPKIGVNIPIYYGTDEKQLQSGAGFWMGSSLPTGGPDTHTVLTAHTGLVRAKLFTDLDQLTTGDQFYIKVLDRVLAYEVDQRQIVDPDNLEPMYIQPGEDLVTLYTCYPYGVNTHRLLVRGHRIPYEEQLENQENLIEKLVKNGYAWFLILPLILLLWWMRNKRKKKHSLKQDALPVPIGVDALPPKTSKNQVWIRRIPIYLRKRHLRTRLMNTAERNKARFNEDLHAFKRKQRPHHKVPIRRKPIRQMERLRDVRERPRHPKAVATQPKAQGRK